MRSTALLVGAPPRLPRPLSASPSSVGVVRLRGSRLCSIGGWTASGSGRCNAGLSGSPPSVGRSVGSSWLLPLRG
eukprot:10531191-Alexandrium_andersonii.AAC.1